MQSNWMRAALVTAALAALVPAAQAGVVYSGTLNLVIPNSNSGLYVNVITGGTYSGPSTFPTAADAAFNWDFDLFGASTWNLYSPQSGGQINTVPTTSRGYVAISSSGIPLALSIGTLIGGSSLFNPNQMSTTALTTGTEQIFGFRFRNENDLSTTADDTVHYGWARVILTNGRPGTLVDYGYESTPLTAIAAGAVPEPGTWALMLGGLAAVGARRKWAGRAKAR